MLKMVNAAEETQKGNQMLRMSETPKGPQLKLSTQDPAEAQQQIETELPKSTLPRESDLEDQRAAERTKPGWIKCRCSLWALVLAFCLCVVLLGMVYYIHHSLRGGNWKQEVLASPCNSPACQRASVHLSMSADPFTHPCDYFLFSCGPDGSSSKAQGHQREKSRRDVKEKRTLDRKTELLQYLREILESNDSLASSAVQKAKAFYRTCLDTKSLDIAGEEPFLALIHKLGGWSVSGQWNQTDFNSTLSVLMRDYATFPFFNAYVDKDPNDTSGETTKRYIQIDQPDLLIPIEWISEKEKSQVIRETLHPFLASCSRYLALLGSPPDSSSMIHVGAFVSLSSELAVAMAPLSHRKAKGQLSQRLTIKELQSMAPAVDWLGCLQAAFHSPPLTEDERVLLHNLPYVVQMSHIIGKWMSGHELSPSGPLHTFMLLNLLHTLLPALDSRFSETANNFSVVLGHVGVRQGDLDSKPLSEGFTAAPRWKRCVLETERGFDGVLAHLLGINIAGGEAEELVENILSSFKSQLYKLKWHNQKTLQFVMRKGQSVTPKIGTTTEKSSEAELDLLYSEVSVSLDSFFSNYLQLLSLLQKRRSKLLHDDWISADILSVTPSLLGNELSVPMGIFIPPLFHPTYPRAMNYGVLGFLLAKDLLHVLLPDIYSQSVTVRDVGQCVWSRYRSVTNNESEAPPLPTAQQQEVWLQFSALQIALEAYQKSLKKQPADTSISGFSTTRLFFVAFSQVNCDADRYHHLMPLEPSFLVTAVCAKSHLCPTTLQCPKTTRRYSSHGC
ncbi:kell blood group glycoprotein isoform X1 [Syngnathus acus]|uniref:kell blood group glycoprotein isoform X1 n=1 Tax=Syngnathus acus TaxID=161584 RepID=UPI001885AB4E|nr:kell blood group glycoprotein isoform X1 [Syngnathus acus]XP_037129095.1 kell blood group glycoprotein isoform X1 [Syngnathus acus]